MTPFLAVPHAQAAAPIQSSSIPYLPMAPQGIAQMTWQSAPPAVAYSETYNNSHGVGAQDEFTTQSGNPNSVDNAAFFSLSGRGGTILTRGFSSMFLAQMLGQSDGVDSDMIQFFDAQPRSATPDTQQLERYAASRYMPSFAFKAPPAPAATETVQIAQAQTAAVESAPQAQKARTATTLTTGEISPRIAQVLAATPTANMAQTSHQPLRTERRMPGITSRGIDAYQATMSRNAEAITKNTAPVEEISEVR